MRARLLAEGVRLHEHAQVAAPSRAGPDLARRPARLPAPICWWPPAARPRWTVWGSRPPASPSTPRASRSTPAAHDQRPRVRDRRRGGRPAVHPRRRLPGGDRDPQRAVPPASPGQHAGHAARDLHRPRARRGGPERGAGARAGLRHEIVRWPFADNDRARAERRPRGWSRWWPGAVAGCWVRPSSARMPAS